MILVDSSAWIAWLRDDGTRAARVLSDLDLRKEGILVGDLVLMEVLRGARSERAARAIEADLRRFAFAELGGREAAVAAANMYRQLRGVGVTIRSSVDMLIGAYCLREGHTLLHQDRGDFRPMERHLGLRCL